MPSIVLSALSHLILRIGLLHLGGEKSRSPTTAVKFKFHKSEAQEGRADTGLGSSHRAEAGASGTTVFLSQVGMPDLANYNTGHPVTFKRWQLIFFFLA